VVKWKAGGGITRWDILLKLQNFWVGDRRLFQDLPYLLVSGVTIELITRVTALKGKKDIYKIKAVFKVPERDDI
jgi:hypothetical protein